MPGTHHYLLYHLVFSTKERKPYLSDPSQREKMFGYLGATAKGLQGQPLIVGGWIDHVHLLVRLKTTHCLADFMRELKANSSKHWNCSSGQIQKFGWQDGYGAFTVSRSQSDTVTAYIANQENHHQSHTFQAEYVRLLDKYEIEYDDRYLWD